MSVVLKIPHFDNLLSRYMAGEPEHKLAREWGISRYALHSHLLESSIHVRTQSEMEFLKWSKMTPKQRANQTRNAHVATRGKKLPIETQIKRAKTVEQLQRPIAPAEKLLAQWLSAAGLSITQQKAVFIYNLDITINEPPIAVEIFGGYWHAYGTHLARFHQRTKYLLDSGWHVVIVWVDGIQHPLDVACADYIIALANELSTNPLVARQYRVIWGDSKSPPTAERYFNTTATIERLYSTN